MNLYLWQIESEECTCYYGIVEEDKETAREKVIDLIKEGESVCIRCVSLKGAKEWENMIFEEKREDKEYRLNNCKSILIEYIIKTEPILHKEKVPFKR